MRLYIITWLLACLWIGQASAQSTQERVEALIRQGIELHDVQKYDQAIAKYKDALKLDKKNLTAFYELALSYLAKKDYKSTILYADKAIKGKYEYAYQAYDLKGTALDELGKTQEAIENYEQGIKEYENYYLLHYNLGITLIRNKRYEESEKCFKKSILLNPSHPGSHYHLASIAEKRGDKLQNILAGIYFLMLETNTDLSKSTSTVMDKQLHRLLENAPSFSELRQKDEVIDTQSLKNYEKIFTENHPSDSLYKVMPLPEEPLELQKLLYLFLTKLQKIQQNKDDIWHKFYIPFFIELAKSKHLEAISYIISFAEDEEKVAEWVQFNQSKVDDFGKWYESYFSQKR